jgi:hypothetical protein
LFFPETAYAHLVDVPRRCHLLSFLFLLFLTISMHYFIQ